MKRRILRIAIVAGARVVNVIPATDHKAGVRDARRELLGAVLQGDAHERQATPDLAVLPVLAVGLEECIHFCRIDDQLIAGELAKRADLFLAQVDIFQTINGAFAQHIDQVQLLALGCVTRLLLRPDQHATS
ncbi:hypothetical protein ALQ20_200141 [Pseudomonas syringae pv. atrofaciens]|nr:hypothetical protein ALQ20_200141 [Pseudomonas syringae pv. atrofaciens]